MLDTEMPAAMLHAHAAVRVPGIEGRLVNIGSAAGPIVRFESAILRGRLHTILGYTNAALTNEQKEQALTEILTCCWSLYGRERNGAVEAGCRSLGTAGCVCSL